APEVPLASSKAGFIERRVGPSSRNTKGTEARAWQTIRPGILKTLIGPLPSSPKIPRNQTFIQPAFGPSRKIQATASTTLGTRRGNRMSENQRSRQGRSVRSTNQASTKAMTKFSATEL